jgi:hypothetical protein
VNEEVVIGGDVFQLRDLEPADRADLLALHAGVFADGADEDWYRWKYVQGQGLGTGVWKHGELIAHCGGVPRMLWRGGVATSGIQIGDVMVAPRWRGLLTRRGPFFQASHGFYSAHVGKRTAHSIAFGFPSERHTRLAVTLKLLWDAGPIHSLSFRMDAQPLPAWQWRWSELQPSEPGFDAAVERAWGNMRAAMPDFIVGDHGARYVRWRYCERPGRSRRLFALRRPWSAAPTGIAVLDLAAPQAQWLDWIGAPKHLARASRACVAQARASGAAGLTAWATPAVAEFLPDSTLLGRTVTAQLGVPCASALTGDEAAQARWWFMGGDTDFL